MMSKMKASVFYEPFKMQMEEVDIPEIAANEVLVKVKAVGICGSDLEYYYGGSPLTTPDGKGPLILGHETAGIVEDPGEIGASMGLKKGDEVVVNPVAPCFACKPCLHGHYNECDNVKVYGVGENGAFAEYVKSAATNVYKIPEGMSLEMGALAEPMACASYGIKKLDIQQGDTAIVFGCGTIGLIDVQLAHMNGAGQVIAVDVVDYNLEKALELGALHAFNTLDQDSKYYTADLGESIRAINNGRLADKAILPTGAMSAWQQALEVTAPCSTIVYFGLPSKADAVLQIPALDAIYNDRNIKFSWLAPLVWDNVFAALANGRVKLDSLITHRFSLDDIEEGIKFMRESKEKKIKGIMVID
ncbi:MAG: alcohol dehydrogenase catalytic domain-containing protein [Christensenella sp.]|uniref:zinc-dependent alcohol dehydrogenase n=1 Tax=Christensenella sp. TaxID=1935934 RepID=UPI002B210A35|nr:alcohol dehydrogenase catalytic domain-containing protein [Christensenella sp.]MEA5003387.1 alcohol dehydrogenase catalytic domain-containing protein [Christensenella sp.]